MISLVRAVDEGAGEGGEGDGAEGGEGGTTILYCGTLSPASCASK